MFARRFLSLAGFIGFATATLPASSLIVMPGRPSVRDAASFAAMDADGDGRVSKAEYVQFEVRRRFTGADVNKDGKLSKEEFFLSIKNEPRTAGDESWKQLNGGKDFVTLDDVLHNNRVTKEISAEFEKLDRSGRGYVTAAEWTKGKRKTRRPAQTQ